MNHILEANLGYRVETLAQTRGGGGQCGFALDLICSNQFCSHNHAQKAKTNYYPCLVCTWFLFFIQICIWKTFASQTAK